VVFPLVKYLHCQRLLLILQILPSGTKVSTVQVVPQGVGESELGGTTVVIIRAAARGEFQDIIALTITSQQSRSWPYGILESAKDPKPTSFWSKVCHGN
jgi:hypothetical protein